MSTVSYETCPACGKKQPGGHCFCAECGALMAGEGTVETRPDQAPGSECSAERQAAGKKGKACGWGCSVALLLAVVLLLFASFAPERRASPAFVREIAMWKDQATKVGDGALLGMLLSTDGKTLEVFVSDGWFSMPEYMRKRFARGMRAQFAAIAVKYGVEPDYTIVHIRDRTGAMVARDWAYGTTLQE